MKTQTLEIAHNEFLQYHLNKCSGERRARLERGHQHGEKLFAKMYGGLMQDRLMICILNMRCRIFGVDLIIRTSLISRLD